MYEETIQSEKPIGSNPLIAIAIAVIVALSMVAVTTTIFLRSSAYDTVKQIQTGSRLVRSMDHKGLDVLSPIKASDIDVFVSDVNNRIRLLDDNGDFGLNDVSDASLGL